MALLLLSHYSLLASLVWWCCGASSVPAVRVIGGGSRVSSFGVTNHVIGGGAGDPWLTSCSCIPITHRCTTSPSKKDGSVVMGCPEGRFGCCQRDQDSQEDDVIVEEEHAPATSPAPTTTSPTPTTTSPAPTTTATTTTTTASTTSESPVAVSTSSVPPATPPSIEVTTTRGHVVQFQPIRRQHTVSQCSCVPVEVCADIARRRARSGMLAVPACRAPLVPCCPIPLANDLERVGPAPFPLGPAQSPNHISSPALVSSPSVMPAFSLAGSDHVTTIIPEPIIATSTPSSNAEHAPDHLTNAGSLLQNPLAGPALGPSFSPASFPNFGSSHILTSDNRPAFDPSSGQNPSIVGPASFSNFVPSHTLASNNRPSLVPSSGSFHIPSLDPSSFPIPASDNNNRPAPGPTHDHAPAHVGSSQSFRPPFFLAPPSPPPPPPSLHQQQQSGSVILDSIANLFSGRRWAGRMAQDDGQQFPDTAVRTDHQAQ